MANDISSTSSSFERPLQVGMLLYPNMTLLDLVGPQAALGIHGKTFLLAPTMDPVVTDTGVSLNPTTIFAECPADLDVFFVPGGVGTNDALQNKAIIEFLAEYAPKARYVTSVCTGSILLAAAGLLSGYKAATHWAFYDQLAANSDVEPVHARVVVDRNRITGGGVTAGLDFGLSLLALLRNETVAKVTQLMLEYDPAPPFSAGTPSLAGPEVTAAALSIIQPSIDTGVALSRAGFQERSALQQTA